MAEQLVTIRNTGTDKLHAAVLTMAAAFVVAVAFTAAAILLLAGEPAHVQGSGIAVPAVAAIVSAGLLGRALLEYLEAPVSIEYSDIVLIVRYPSRPFLGLSWSEIISFHPAKIHHATLGGPLHDLRLSIHHKKHEVLQNLSPDFMRTFFVAYQVTAKKLSRDEAESAADRIFDIQRF